MSAPGLSAEQMIHWSDFTSRRWRNLVAEHPEALSFPCDVYRDGDVAGLLHHIAVVELRYAQRIAGLPETAYEDVAKDADSIFATHETAFSLLRECLDDETFDWQKSLEFNTISMGRLRSTRETIFIHTIFHGIRHYAQLATIVRQNGVKTDWPMDYLMMGAERVVS